MSRAELKTRSASAEVIEQRKRELIVRLATMTDTECDFADGFELRDAARFAMGEGAPAHWCPRYSTEDRERAVSALRARWQNGSVVPLDEAVDVVAEALGMSRAE